MTDEQFQQLMAKLEEIKEAVNPRQCYAPGCLKAAVEDKFCSHHSSRLKLYLQLVDSLAERDDFDSESHKRRSNLTAEIENELGA